MSLKQNILDLQKEAMKAGEKEKLSTLRLLTAEIKNIEIKEQKELDDVGILKVITSQVKKIRDSLKDFEGAGREDLADGVKAELEVLEQFLPEQMSDDELKKIVTSVIDEIKPEGKQDFGRVMGAVMGRVAGKADGKRVKDAVSELL